MEFMRFCPEARLAPSQVQWEIIHSIYLFQDTTFLDYIRGGLKLHFVVAIDFTTSNGLPNDPNSLHYWDRQRAENPYTVAIRSVGEIFQDYDVGMYVVLFLISHPWCHFLPMPFSQKQVFFKKDLKGMDSFNQIFCILLTNMNTLRRSIFDFKKGTF